MSYCRFSSDNWGCDLYCYETESGYCTHVNAARIVGSVPKVDHFLLIEGKIADFFAVENQQLEFVRKAKREPITLEHAGRTFRDPDLQSFLRRLLDLRGLGYHVPDYTIEQVTRELREEREKMEKENKREDAQAE